MEAQPEPTPGGLPLGLCRHAQLGADHVLCLSLSWWQGDLGAIQEGCREGEGTAVLAGRDEVVKSIK